MTSIFFATAVTCCSRHGAPLFLLNQSGRVTLRPSKISTPITSEMVRVRPFRRGADGSTEPFLLDTEPANAYFASEMEHTRGIHAQAFGYSTYRHHLRLSGECNATSPSTH